MRRPIALERQRVPRLWVRVGVRKPIKSVTAGKDRHPIYSMEDLGIYGYLAFLTLILGFLANRAFENLLDHHSTCRRYIPPQRLRTTRYNLLLQGEWEVES